MPTDADLPLHCTFAAEEWRKLAQHWYPIAASEDVGQQPVAATLLDQPLVAYRAANELVVARDVCAHRGVPLSLGSADGEGVVCRYHGLRYGAQGLCNLVPSSPHERIPSRLRLKVYPAVEKYKLIWVCLSPAAQALPDVPFMPHWDDSEFQQILCPAFDVNAFAGRQLEGFIDVAHFAYVHSNTFADAKKADVPAYMPVETEKGFTVDYRSFVGNYPIGVNGRADTSFEWLRRFDVHLPLTATLTIHFPDDGRLVIMNAASPVSARKTRLFAPIARNFDKELSVADVHAFNLRVFQEDREIVESQVPEYVPLDLGPEAHIPADRNSLAYRRGLKRMGFGQAFGAPQAFIPVSGS